mmetsp:Transcript_22405/g.66725  ORF Transcript_22405/g.66725 Transcript_22405/m.66725 type:complete len:120 (-) Transcript_22405:16-375(-)
MAMLSGGSSRHLVEPHGPRANMVNLHVYGKVQRILRCVLLIHVLMVCFIVVKLILVYVVAAGVLVLVCGLIGVDVVLVLMLAERGEMLLRVADVLSLGWRGQVWLLVWQGQVWLLVWRG